MAINYCFDVPVKLLATILVAMCLFLLFRDYRRLLNFFFKNADAPASNLSPHRFKTRWKNVTLTVVKYLLVAYVVIGDLISAYQAGQQYGEGAKKPAFYGIYNVQYFVRGRDTLPPLTTDSTRWNKLLIGNYGNANIRLMNDSTRNYNFKADTVKHVFTMYTDADTVHKTLIAYAQLKNNTYLLSYKGAKDSIHLKLVKFDLNKFQLLSRGFHWVNEFPYVK